MRGYSLYTSRCERGAFCDYFYTDAFFETFLRFPQPSLSEMVWSLGEERVFAATANNARGHEILVNVITRIVLPTIFSASATCWWPSTCFSIIGPSNC